MIPDENIKIDCDLSSYPHKEYNHSSPKNTVCNHLIAYTSYHMKAFDGHMVRKIFI